MNKFLRLPLIPYSTKLWWQETCVDLVAHDKSTSFHQVLSQLLQSSWSAKVFSAKMFWAAIRQSFLLPKVCAMYMVCTWKLVIFLLQHSLLHICCLTCQSWCNRYSNVSEHSYASQDLIVDSSFYSLKNELFVWAFIAGFDMCVCHLTVNNSHNPMYGNAGLSGCWIVISSYSYTVFISWPTFGLHRLNFWLPFIISALCQFFLPTSILSMYIFRENNFKSMCGKLSPVYLYD